jgi:MFS family permease
MADILMISHESDSTPEPSHSDADSALDSTPPADHGRANRRPAPAWIWVFTLATGLAAGVGAWALAEPIYGRYQPAPTSATQPTPAESDAAAAEQRRAMILETSLTFGTLGALLGLTFGMAGGFARGSLRGGLAAAAIGLMLGAAGGLGAGWLLTSMQDDLIESVADDLLVALLVQGGICAVVGAMAGSAFSLGLGEDDRRFDFRVVVGGLLGAVAGLIVYQMAGGIAFPLDGTSLPLSKSWATRLIAKALVAGCAAIGVMLAMSANARVR